MALALTYVWNLREEYLAVEYKDGLIESVDDFEGEIRAGEKFEVQVYHHLHANSKDSLNICQFFSLQAFQ